MRREVSPNAGAFPVTQHPQNTYKVNVSLEPVHPVVFGFRR